MLDKLLLLVLITFIPALELRLSIPIGILSGKIDLPFGFVLEGMGLPWPLVFAVAVGSNMLLGPILYFALHHLLKHVLKIPFAPLLYNRAAARASAKTRALIEKYGFIGLALFIGFPLPGTGSWSGALAAYLLGIPAKKFVAANALGVLLAGTVVTAVALGVVAL